MSYRKKHTPEKSVRPNLFDLPAEPEYSTSGTERTIPSSKLTSGLPYQRPVDGKEVSRLIREWDDRLLDPVVVSFRDGRFYVVDGQHRVAAMRWMNDGGTVMVPCKVYDGLTYEQEADLCYKLDKAKKRLSLSQSTNALVESGADAESAEIRRLLERCGFTWALGQKSRKQNEVVSTRAVINAYRLLGGASFSRMFSLLRATWDGEPCSVNAVMISGLALFLKTYDTELNDSTFIKRLSAVDPDEIIRRGKLDFSTNRTALRYARVLLEKYNGTRGGKKLPYRLQD